MECVQRLFSRRRAWMQGKISVMPESIVANRHIINVFVVCVAVTLYSHMKVLYVSVSVCINHRWRKVSWSKKWLYTTNYYYLYHHTVLCIFFIVHTVQGAHTIKQCRKCEAILCLGNDTLDKQIAMNPLCDFNTLYLRMNFSQTCNASSSASCALVSSDCCLFHLFALQEVCIWHVQFLGL